MSHPLCSNSWLMDTCPVGAGAGHPGRAQSVLSGARDAGECESSGVPGFPTPHTAPRPGREDEGCAKHHYGLFILSPGTRDVDEPCRGQRLYTGFNFTYLWVWSSAGTGRSSRTGPQIRFLSEASSYPTGCCRPGTWALGSRPALGRPSEERGAGGSGKGWHPSDCSAL